MNNKKYHCRISLIELCLNQSSTSIVNITLQSTCEPDNHYTFLPLYLTTFCFKINRTIRNSNHKIVERSKIDTTYIHAWPRTSLALVQALQENNGGAKLAFSVQQYVRLFTIKVITKLPNSEQSYLNTVTVTTGAFEP
jgi:hypothetical protein